MESGHILFNWYEEGGMPGKLIVLAHGIGNATQNFCRNPEGI